MAEEQNAARVPKRLVVCFDGTWNNADNVSAETNVARMSRAVHATTGTGGVLQSVLYLRGVGTTGLDVSQKFNGATGLGIDDNIRSGYMFIAQNYVPGDEIYLFGFSRGAFTARSLVGLISATGLLKRQSLNQLGRAWDYYRHGARPHSADGFLDFCATVQGGSAPALHTDVEIKFLGVWDTVGSLGIPGHLFDDINHDLYGFYDTDLCPIVRNAYHALAIDEHRDSFVPTLWTGKVPDGCAVEQVWFAGAHADVGGGYVTRELADIPLVWMAKRAESVGLVLDWKCLPTPGQARPVAPRHNSSSGIFIYNRAIPTIREVCGRRFDVPFYQRLYVPIDPHGQPLVAVNEWIHGSVAARHGASEEICTDDDKGMVRTDPYHSENVAALFKTDGEILPEIKVWKQDA